LLLVWLLLLLVQSLLGNCNRIVSCKNSERMIADLRNLLYAHLQSLPIGYFHNRKYGQTLSLLSYDTSIIGSFVSGTLIGIIPHCVTALGALVCMFLISPSLAALTALLLPLFVVITKVFRRKTRPLSRELMQRYEHLHSIAEENLSSIPLIKSFTREPIELEHFRQGNEELFLASHHYHKEQSQLAPITGFLSGAMIILFLLLAGDRLLAGSLTTGQLISLFLYGLLLTRPFSTMAGVYGQGQRALTSMQRLAEPLSENPERHHSGQPLPPVRGDITFCDLAFAYPDRDPLFSSLNLTIPAGQTIAITGRNGSGKSTLVHLLIRLLTPDQGQVLIDSINIQSVSLASLRAQIGLLQQSVLLRNSTVRDILLFGKADAIEAELVQAARAAHAYDFIAALPEGFDTIIGDRGVKLSGGQKQRLSLARTLKKTRRSSFSTRPPPCSTQRGKAASFATISRRLARKRC
jgi:ATP-binding cassette, subfamily B, bacterial